MSHLKIMFRPHPSVSLSVCHSVSQTNQFVLFSWNSVLQFCTKRVSSKLAFREKSLNASCTLLKTANEFLHAHFVLLDRFVWTGTENVHIMLFCKYQINPLDAKLNPICYLLALFGAHHILHISRIRVNRNWRSGSHIVFQGVD